MKPVDHFEGCTTDALIELMRRRRRRSSLLGYSALRQKDLRETDPAGGTLGQTSLGRRSSYVRALKSMVGTRGFNLGGSQTPPLNGGRPGHAQYWVVPTELYGKEKMAGSAV